MKQNLGFSPARVLLPVSVGTCLSLLGDASLYAVLPTHTVDAGISMAGVGALLSANRFIRLALNGPAGMLFDRFRRRHLFVPALFLGACSTALYWMTSGFWPLLIGRLLWGMAWVGIWIGGNTIILDIAGDDTRGRWVGGYQVSFFAGSAGGSLLGGMLTDRLGYHQAMGISAAITFLGAVIALLFLPETRGLKRDLSDTQLTSAASAPSRGGAPKDDSSPASRSSAKGEFTTAVALYAVHRLARAGILQPTFGLFLLQEFGQQVKVAGHSLGVATLTGIGLGLSTLISAASAFAMGGLSDRWGNRWRVAAVGLIPGVVGFSFLATGLPAIALIGISLAAVTGGSNQGLSTALIGDLGNTQRRGRRLGILFTMGDLTSAVGPPLAYALMPLIGIKNLYLSIGVLFASLFAIVLEIDRKRHR